MLTVIRNHIAAWLRHLRAFLSSPEPRLDESSSGARYGLQAEITERVIEEVR